MGAINNTRKSVDLEMVGGKGRRQRLWEAIRARRNDFTMLDVACVAEVDTDTTRSYLQALERGGFIEQSNITVRRGEEKHYCLQRDHGLEAPRLTRNGQLVTQGLAQEQMWRTMRILGGEFNYQELAGLASTAEVTVAPTAAQHYLKHLAHAGYVTVVVKGKGRGAGGVASRYRFNLARYSGPRPPMVQRTKNVYDPNLGRVVWQEDINDDN